MRPARAVTGGGAVMRAAQCAAGVACAFVALATLSACRNSATRSVAVGARGTVSTMYGPCTAPSGGPVRFTTAERYEAVSAGTARIRCRAGDVILDVRVPARIAIRAAPQTTSGRRLVYGASVFDATGRELDLGDDAALRWTFGGSLSARPNPGCGDIVPLCPAASGGFATAGAPGSGTIRVAFGSLHAASATTVTAR